MEIKIPEFCLVALVGTSGSGKSTFAKKHFLPSELISSDACRALVSDSETDQAATNDAFDVLNYIADKRLSRGKLTVIDATNVQSEARKSIIGLAKDHDCFAVAVVLNLPERVCQDRNNAREDRNFGRHVVRRQNQLLRKSISSLKKEGFRYVFVLDDQESIDSVSITRTKLWTDRRDETGPFDIIGDIHGCFDELIDLLKKLDYKIDYGTDGFLGDGNSTTTILTGHDTPELEREMSVSVIPPPGRKVIFLGDLVDRGPKSPQVLNLVMRMVADGTAICVPGNHDVKLLKKLQGRNVRISHGLAETLEQLESHTDEFKNKVVSFVSGLISHFVLDEGKLVVSHAGMKASYQGRSSGRVRNFALFGDTTGETDEFGLPIRYEWATEYRGESMVVYGHTPVGRAEWINRTINIDTGCVFGGELTCLRYPERELVSVQAHKEYYQSVKPFKEAITRKELVAGKSARQMMGSAGLDADILRIEDVIGKRRINTRYRDSITIQEENSAAALESISRFAVDPHWLIYLPPTMSPCETSDYEDFLERPEEALSFYSSRGINHVICQEKHMGSRAVAIVCRDLETARQRFGSVDDTEGVCYTRTGRRFFADAQIEKQFLQSLKNSLEASDFFSRFETDWVALDCELLPWSQKAQELLKDQYAKTGAAAIESLSKALKTLKEASARGLKVDALVDKLTRRSELAELYVNAYRQYCWKVDSLEDLKLAPFHILATEGSCHFDKDHGWHMSEIKRICDHSDSLMITTRFIELDLSNPDHIVKAVEWWEALTEIGGEGMVVKPLQFIAMHRGNIVQPAVKCRGKEYLRIIYGPEYTLAENIDRLRQRGLSSKRSLALREFALGLESLELFVKQEPLYKVHESVFAVLALESEPVDPRL